jgi:hypothetical protein
LAPSLIIATDTAFSSNRFAWPRQVRKVDLEVELKEIAMYQLLASIIEMQSSDRPCSHGCHGIAEAALVIEVGAATLDWQSTPIRCFAKRSGMEAEPFEGAITNFYVPRKK